MGHRDPLLGPRSDIQLTPLPHLRRSHTKNDMSGPLSRFTFRRRGFAGCSPVGRVREMLDLLEIPLVLIIILREQPKLVGRLYF